MKLFIDGADPKEVGASARRGLIDGVVAQVGDASGDRHWHPPSALLRELCALVKGPVLVRVVGEDREALLREARALSGLAPNVGVSLSLSKQGLEAVRMCANEGIKINVTGCLNPEQALLAAKAGAAYLSPSLERGGDAAAEGGNIESGDLVRKIVALYRTYGHDTQVLFGPVRNPSQIVDAALAGAHVAVVPYGVLEQLRKQPPADPGLGKLMASK